MLEDIAGVCTVTIATPNGARVMSVAATVSRRLSGHNRETKVGASGPAGRKKFPVVGRMVIACHDAPTLDHSEFDGWDKVSVTAVAATGKTTVLVGGIVGDPPELDLVEGEFTLEFEGQCEEIL